MTTKKMTFKDVMDFDQRNAKTYQELLKIYKTKGLTPFIGAGLSVPVGFPTWKEFLKHECEKSGLSFDELEYYSKADYGMDLASEIYRVVGSAYFLRSVLNAYGGDFSNSDWSRILNRPPRQL